LVTGRAIDIDVPIKTVNPGLWDQLAQGAHEHGMTVDEYCDFLLVMEYAPELLRSSHKKVKE
jgi:hypothetical protein